MTHLCLGSSIVLSLLWGENSWEDVVVLEMPTWIQLTLTAWGRVPPAWEESTVSLGLSTCTVCIPPWQGTSAACLGLLALTAWEEVLPAWKEVLSAWD